VCLLNHKLGEEFDEGALSNWKLYPGICWETEKNNENTRSLGRDFKPGSPEKGANRLSAKLSHTINDSVRCQMGPIVGPHLQKVNRRLYT
jgi:hypothetical protein